MLKKTSKTKQGVNKGATMMVAIIIMGILMVFAFSLLLVTYTLYASQNKKAASRMNATAANTLSVALETELTDGGSMENYDPMDASELWKYLRFNIGQEGTWPYYYPEATYSGHDDKCAFRYFKLDYNYTSKYFETEQHKALYPTVDGGDEVKDYYDPSVLDGFPGSVELCVYWRLPEGVEEDYKSTEAQLSGSNKINMDAARLYIEIICESASQSYVVTNVYELNIKTPASNEKKTKLSKYAEKDTYNPLQFSTEGEINLQEDWSWTFISRE